MTEDINNLTTTLMEEVDLEIVGMVDRIVITKNPDTIVDHPQATMVNT